MAISVFFRLIRQDETELEYEFGETPTETDRRLVIDRKTMRVWPTDGRDNYQFEAARRRISILLGQQGPGREGQRAELTPRGDHASEHRHENIDWHDHDPRHDEAFAGATIRPRDDIPAMEWAEHAYDWFRADAGDVAAIAERLHTVKRSDGRVGFSEDEIQRVKNHVMVEEHRLGYDESDFHSARFDADPGMAEAWIRLRGGGFEPADLVLLEHELTEAGYLQEHPGASYIEAHKYAHSLHN